MDYPGAEFTVIFSHGNSSDLGHMVYRAMDLALFAKVSVVLYDYSGYGLASGKASEASLNADIRAAFQYTTVDLKVPWSRVILYGQSLGSAPTIDLASQEPVGGVILHSPLASLLLIIAKDQTSSPDYDIFRNISKVDRLRCPVFYMHGTHDRVVPIRNSEWLHSKTTSQYPPWWIEGGDHNRLEIDFRSEFYMKLREFVDFLGGLHDQLDNEDMVTRLSPRSAVTPKLAGKRAVSPEC